MDGPYVLHGHECLVFFLGGIPYQDPADGRVRHDGLRQGPGESVHEQPGGGLQIRREPESDVQRQPAIAVVRVHRQPAFPGPEQRDELERHGEPGSSRLLRFAYQQSAADDERDAQFLRVLQQLRQRGYDPNDVNFPTEADANLASPIWLQFFTASSLNHRVSPAPNPYTTSSTVTANNVLTYREAADLPDLLTGRRRAIRRRGPVQLALVGQFVGQHSAAVRWGRYVRGIRRRDATTDTNVRNREKDNLTNFQSAKLD